MKEHEMKVHHLNIRQSISIVILRLAALDLISVVLILLIYIPFSRLDISPNFTTQLFSFSSFLLLILVFSKMLLSFYVVFQWLNEYYEITPIAIFHRKGFILKKVEKCSYRNIKSVAFHQGFFGKLFNYGTLTLYLWPVEKQFLIYLIHNPRKYLHLLEKFIPHLHEEHKILREHMLEEEEGYHTEIGKETLPK